MGLRLKIILNPSSGKERARINIEDMLSYIVSLGELQRADIHYTSKRYDALEFAKNTNPEDYDYLVVAGGDGTVNEVVSGLMEGNVDIPLAIYTSGTVNDFARINNLPTSPSDFARMLLDPDIRKVDCGKAGDSYFLNVLAAGAFTDVAYTVPSEYKTTFGPLAYWAGALKDIPTLNKTTKIRFQNELIDTTVDTIMFFISNTSSVGGFKKLMSEANHSDGKLDVLILKKLDLQDVVPLLGNLMLGDHIKNDNVVYFQTDNITITTESDAKITVDVDGEMGTDLPITVTCIPNSISLIVPKEEN